MTPNQATDSTKPETAERERANLAARLDEADRFAQFSDLAKPIKADIRAAIALLAADGKAGGEAIGEVVLEDMGVAGSDARAVRFHMYKEIPPIGTKLYTRPQQAAQVAQPLNDVQILDALYMTPINWMWMHEKRIIARAIEAAHGIGKDQS